MEYKVNGLDAIKSPVILRMAEGEQEFHNGRAAGEATFDRPYLIASISAEDSKIIVELSENKGRLDVAWSDRPVNLFDGD